MKRHPILPKKWASLIPYLLSIIAIAVFLNYLRQNAGQYRDLFHISSQTLLTLFLLSVLTMVLNGLSNYILYHRLGAAVTVNESIGLSAINTLANLLPIIAGGLISVGIYLKKKFALSYTHYLSAAIAIYVIFVATNGLLGNLTLLYWTFNGENVPLGLVIGFLGMSASLLLFVIPLKSINLPEKWQNYLLRALEGWEMLSRDKMSIGQLIGVQMLLIAVYAWQLLLAFRSLSQPVTFTHCVVFAVANILTQLVSITPDGFGIRESLIAGMAAIFGFDTAASALAVVLVRLVVLPPIIATGTLYTYLLSKKAVASATTAHPAAEEETPCL